MKRRTLLTVAIFAALYTSVLSFDNTDSLSIAVVTWRGVTEAEEGFISYFTLRNLPVRFRTYNCAKRCDNLPAILKKVRTENPDCIYTFGTTVTTFFMNNEQHIPIVFAVVADPEGAGIVSSTGVSRRKNVTGVSHLVPMDAQLRAMRSVTPVKSIGFIYNPEEKNSLLQLAQLSPLSITDSFDVYTLPLSTHEKKKITQATFKKEIAPILEKHPDIVYLPSDSYIISHAQTIVSAIHNAGIPTFSATEGPIKDAGAFMGLVSRYKAVGQFAGYKAKQILFDSVAISEVPIERLKRFSFLINMNAAHNLNCYPPVPLFRFAEVISASSADK